MWRQLVDEAKAGVKGCLAGCPFNDRLEHARRETLLRSLARPRANVPEVVAGNLTGTPQALNDLANPEIDHRVASLVRALLAYGDINIRLVKTGHPMGPVSPAGRVNDHWFYRAIDIDAVDGCEVSDRSIGPPVIGLGRHLLAMPVGQRPDLVMGPASWHEALGGGVRTGFRDDPSANKRHRDHLHLGFADRPPATESGRGSR